MFSIDASVVIVRVTDGQSISLVINQNVYIP
jgi:hypothetical protein